MTLLVAFYAQLNQIIFCCVLRQFTTFLDVFYNNFVRSEVHPKLCMLFTHEIVDSSLTVTLAVVNANLHTILRFFCNIFTLKWTKTWTTPLGIRAHLTKASCNGRRELPLPHPYIYIYICVYV
jgi:hypothetical protein